MDRNKVDYLRHFVSDSPIRDNSGDKFQTSQVAELILTALEQPQIPTHLALLGPWGSGKTSVLRMLEDLLKIKRPDAYEIKFLSVWKFADDAPSLHRKIVREIERELGYQNPSGLDIQFVENEEMQTKGFLGLLANFMSVEKDVFKYISIFLVIAGVSFTIWGAIIKEVFPTIAGLLPLVLVNLDNLQRKFSVSKKLIALSHGDQYEERFEKVVESFKKDNKGKKLILVFDDMDRLPPKQLVAALNTIKTFLQSKECIFIVPCDENILREAIAQVVETSLENSMEENAEEIKKTTYENEERTVSEFITKTFDLIFRLPALEQTNMKRYAKNVLVEQKIEWTTESNINVDRILGILIHSGIKTPRQVINMLNAFSMDWQLASRRDKKSGHTLLTKNTQTVAIFSVLKTDFPKFYAQLISNPYLLNNIDEQKDEFLRAFLSRVQNYLPEDPRHFVYFSNSELNETAGKPHIEKAKEYLVNRQADLFEESFIKLGQEEKGLVLRSFIDDLEINAGIEIENALHVLLETKCTVRVPMVHESRWDEIVSQNIEVFMEYSIADVYEVSQHLVTHSAIWKSIGEAINVSTQFDQLVQLWKNESKFDEILHLQSFATQLEDVALKSGKGYWLLNVLFELISGHRMLSINWIELLVKTLSEENDTIDVGNKVNLANWLKVWSTVTNQLISPSLLDRVFESIKTLDDELLHGMGEFWCKIYESQNGELSDIERLTKQMVDKEHLHGFLDTDFSVIGNLLNGNGAEIVEQFLLGWWKIDKDKTMEIFHALEGAAGLTDFCYQALEVITPEKYKTTMLDYLLKSEDPSKYFDGIIEHLDENIDTDGAVKIINTLAESYQWRGQMENYSEKWVPIQDPNIWLSLDDEETVKRKIQIFWAICKENKTRIEQLRQSIKNLVAVCKGYPSYVGVGGGNTQYSSRYLNLIFNSVIENIESTDIAKNIREWNEISIDGVPRLTLMDSLDSSTKEAMLLALHRMCQMSDETYNYWLSEFADFENHRFQQAAAERWSYLDVQQRNRIISKLPEPEGFVTMLLGWARKSCDINAISELVSWGLDDQSNDTILREIIKHAPIDELNTWLSESFDELNRLEEKWRMIAVKVAIELREDLSWPPDGILETTLGLKDGRTKLALELIAKFPKSKKRKIKEKVVTLSDHFPELVEQAKKSNSWRYRNLSRR